VNDNDISLSQPMRNFWKKEVASAVRAFTPTEKVAFVFFLALLGISAFVMVSKINQSFMVKIPALGGTLEEGIVGTPRFINPVLALGDADRDLTTLVYSGLLKVNTHGALVPDLAESYTVSTDGLEYTFVLRKDARFHDDTPVTIDDIEFTIQKIQDPAIKSPKRANWDGVTTSKINENTVVFTLKKPYSPFIENTTIGILPKHLWKNVDAEQFQFSPYNIRPIGSGPYLIKKIVRDSDDVPQSYNLTSFKKYALGPAHIKTLVLHFYTNEQTLLEAYANEEIESLNSISAKEASELNKTGIAIERAPLPRIFGVFFNQNQAPIFASDEVREALNLAVDKDVIVTEALYGYGTKIDGPIPQDLISGGAPDLLATNTQSKSETERIETAKAVLAKNGWKPNEAGIMEKVIMEKKVKKETKTLRFSLSTPNAPELKKTAELLKAQWEKIGAEVDLKIFDTGELSQNVIRPRKYDAILFGEIIGRDLDLFAFWHSSQRNDPGFNIAMYINTKADKLLEDARVISNTAERLDKYRRFDEIVRGDNAAIFTYSPDFIYIIPNTIQGFSIGQITTPADRFMNIQDWYIETDSVWKIFTE
jgi:peptide/nickel transport system substrate-binding protein